MPHGGLCSHEAITISSRATKSLWAKLSRRSGCKTSCMQFPIRDMSALHLPIIPSPYHGAQPSIGTSQLSTCRLRSFVQENIPFDFLRSPIARKHHA